MSLKICFYASIKDEKKEEIDLLRYYKGEEKGHCIYKIKAGEICSEFIAKYFNKTNLLPPLLLKEIIEENYTKKETETAKEDLKDGVYKVDISKMLIDSKINTNINTFKDSKIVREKLLEKHQEIEKELKDRMTNAQIEIYSIFEV